MTPIAEEIVVDHDNRPVPRLYNSVEEAIRFCQSLGWEVYANIHKGQAFVYRVEPPLWTPEIWYHCTRSSGERYIGGCCGSSSVSQDYMQLLYRMESMQGLTFFKFGLGLFLHDGASDLKKAIAAVQSPDYKPALHPPELFGNPWHEILVVWAALLPWLPKPPPPAPPESPERPGL